MLAASAAFLAAVAVVGVLGLAVAASSQSQSPTVDAPSAADEKPGSSSEKAAAVGETAAPTPSPAKPVITYKTVQKHRSIPFKSEVQSTDTLFKGVVQTQQAGHPGTRVVTFRKTFQDGRLIGREVVSSQVTVQPVAQITLRGTRAPEPARPLAANCDPNYSGQCVPISSDADCAGGSGNGPVYVNGIVKVVGSDVYDLDADGDGLGCD